MGPRLGKSGRQASVIQQWDRFYGLGGLFHSTDSLGIVANATGRTEAIIADGTFLRGSWRVTMHRLSCDRV